MQAFVEEFQLRAVDFDGCAVGLVHSATGLPLLKPWRTYTDNKISTDLDAPILINCFGTKYVYVINRSSHTQQLSHKVLVVAPHENIPVS